MYCLIYKDQFAEMATKGFKGGNYSTDGNWVLGDKADQDMNMWCEYREDKMPQFMKDLGINSCCLTHEKAIELVNNEQWCPRMLGEE
tara:strand:+ start:285 stop:545 length:261 start_codon:yes stop_codon:yes gene_type:complete